MKVIILLTIRIFSFIAHGKRKLSFVLLVNHLVYIEHNGM